MRFAGLLWKTVDGSHRAGLRVPGFQSFTSLDFRTKPLAVLWSALFAYFSRQGRTTRRRYDWMRSPAHAKDGA
jgi:hypothetical protein